jgi:hypothetical protein
MSGSSYFLLIVSVSACLTVQFESCMIQLLWLEIGSDHLWIQSIGQVGLLVLIVGSRVFEFLCSGSLSEIYIRL